MGHPSYGGRSDAYPICMHPTHPRKEREDGWGTQALEAGQEFRRTALVVCVTQKDVDPVCMHPTHPREEREDGWGTQALEAGQEF